MTMWTLDLHQRCAMTIWLSRCIEASTRVPATQFLLTRISEVEVFAYRKSSSMEQYNAFMYSAMVYAVAGINDKTVRGIFDEQAKHHPAEIFVSEVGHGLDSLATKFLTDFPRIVDTTAKGVGIKQGIAKPYTIAESDLWKKTVALRNRRARYTAFAKRRKEQKLSMKEYKSYLADIKKNGPPKLVAPTPEAARIRRSVLIEKRRQRRAANKGTNFARRYLKKKTISLKHLQGDAGNADSNTTVGEKTANIATPTNAADLTGTSAAAGATPIQATASEALENARDAETPSSTANGVESETFAPVDGYLLMSDLLQDDNLVDEFLSYRLDPSIGLLVENDSEPLDTADLSELDDMPMPIMDVEPATQSHPQQASAEDHQAAPVPATNNIRKRSSSDMDSLGDADNGHGKRQRTGLGKAASVGGEEAAAGSTLVSSGVDDGDAMDVPAGQSAAEAGAERDYSDFDRAVMSLDLSSYF